MQKDDYQEKSWYKELTDHEKILLSDLRIIQMQIGPNEPMTPRQNTIRVEFLEKRINELLPSENFFFFKIFVGDSEQARRRNAIEQRELSRLI